jgi:L-aminopeptidase/D-esterase-like protein
MKTIAAIICPAIVTLLLGSAGSLNHAAPDVVSGLPHQIPSPKVVAEGPSLEFDFPSVHVGSAEYEEGPTGATVFYFPKRALAVVDVRGGAPGVINTEPLKLGYDTPFVDAICFAGGSSYGLEAATGVASELLATGVTNTRWDGRIAFVPGAIIFDLGVRYNSIFPDKALGAAALKAARPGRFFLGARGAGRSASQGLYFQEGEPSGQGAGFRQIGPTKIAVFTVVNALGTIVDRQGQVVRCSHTPESGVGRSVADHFQHLAEARKDGVAQAPPTSNPNTQTLNTTITLVVTNQKLSYWQLLRLAVQTHTSMARGIQPFQTVGDGDCLYALSTAEVTNPDLDETDLAAQAAETAWDAILATVPPARLANPSRSEADPKLMDLYVGRYEFRQGAEVLIEKKGGSLVIKSAGTEKVWPLAASAEMEMTASSKSEFVLRNRWNDHIAFIRSASGSVSGLKITRGPRVISARKM